VPCVCARVAVSLATARTHPTPSTPDAACLGPRVCLRLVTLPCSDSSSALKCPARRRQAGPAAAAPPPLAHQACFQSLLFPRVRSRLLACSSSSSSSSSCSGRRPRSSSLLGVLRVEWALCQQCQECGRQQQQQLGRAQCSAEVRRAASAALTGVVRRVPLRVLGTCAWRGTGRTLPATCPPPARHLPTAAQCVCMMQALQGDP
jgi:hypothetical protein